MSRGYACAVVDVGMAYREEIDEALAGCARPPRT